MASVLAGLELCRRRRDRSPATRSTRACSARSVPRASCAEWTCAKCRSREVAEAVGPRTRLVACSHVGWVSGSFAPAELAGVDVPVLLDGAQGVGAVEVDVNALGCDAYAGAGQKWMCGPDGTGMLYVRPELRERLAVARRGYGNLAEANDGLAAKLHDDARRFDTPVAQRRGARLRARRRRACSRTAGWAAVRERAAALAAQLAEPAGRAPAASPRRADTARSCRSPAPIPRASACTSPSRGWSSATFPGVPGCERRSGRGTTSATSIACSKLSPDMRARAQPRPSRGRAHPTRAPQPR